MDPHFTSEGTHCDRPHSHAPSIIRSADTTWCVTSGWWLCVRWGHASQESRRCAVVTDPDSHGPDDLHVGCSARNSAPRFATVSMTSTASGTPSPSRSRYRVSRSMTTGSNGWSARRDVSRVPSDRGRAGTACLLSDRAGAASRWCRMFIDLPDLVVLWSRAPGCWSRRSADDRRCDATRVTLSFRDERGPGSLPRSAVAIVMATATWNAAAFVGTRGKPEA